MTLILPVLFVFGCATDEQVLDRCEAPVASFPEPALVRLTETQYQNSIWDILSEDIIISTPYEPVDKVDGLTAVGASVSTISPLGVERFESAAYAIAEQVMTDESLRATIVPCEPERIRDDVCAHQTLKPLGRRLWRRPLETEELAELVSISAEAGLVLNSFDQGLEFGIAALLQSPHFLFRVELGDESTDGIRPLNAYERASRLSYFLWDTTPDDQLLSAAETGELLTADGLSYQVERLLVDERARQGMRAFFTDMLYLNELDEMTKDPLIYLFMSDDLGWAAREETLQVLERLIFEEKGRYQELFTTQETYVDRRLAAIYNVPAPLMDGFEWVTLPSEDRRRGLLGQVSFLALHAHATSSSPTLRGLFVREVLLCQGMPNPPADLNTSIPEQSQDLPTMRDRIAVHLEDPSCAGCHLMTDPIGLGFENFDGIGRWRTSENSQEIDASGDLDGLYFSDAWDLGVTLSGHTDLAPCLIETMYQYGTNHPIDTGEIDLVAWHADGFAQTEYRILQAMRDIANSPAFQGVGEF